MNISQHVGSSQNRGIADDALKDEDNAAWVVNLAPDIRQAWIDRLFWLRWVDRLAEQDQLISHGQEFNNFYQAWKRLFYSGHLSVEDSHWTVLQQIYQQWFAVADASSHLPAIHAWDRYVEAMGTYHHPNLQIPTLRSYEAMLYRLAGSCFQFFPFLPNTYQVAAGYLGMVDQFYNNLRDLREDISQSVCYFPTEVLAEFGVHRQAILNMECFGDPNYIRMMEFWLDTYLPGLRRKTANLVLAPNLHPSWYRLCTWFVHRYNRIERVFRSCQFNFAEFPQLYWAEVKRDLTLGVADLDWQKPHSLEWIYHCSEMALYLQLSPTTVRTLRRGLGRLNQMRTTCQVNRIWEVQAAPVPSAPSAAPLRASQWNIMVSPFLAW